MLGIIKEVLTIAVQLLTIAKLIKDLRTKK